MKLRIGVLLASPKETSYSNCGLTLFEAAQTRGHELWHFEPSHISLLNGRVHANAAPLHLNTADKNRYIWTDETARTTLNLHELDVVLIRQDPVFDISFLTTTYLLDYLTADTLVLNHPATIRNFPEKLATFGLDDLRPPTLITADYDALHAFWQEHRDIIIKPLYAYGGEGVFRVSENRENLRSLAESMVRHYRCPFVAQRFIPDIKDGDRRALIIYGKVMGIYSRKPAPDEVRSNIKAGGSLEVAVADPKLVSACERLAGTLLRQGIAVAGVDFIGDWLTEINLTTPGGFSAVNELTGAQSERWFWDETERLVAAGAPKRWPLPEGAFAVAS